MAVPYTTEINGKAWNLATDGRRLIAVPGDGFDEAPFPPPDFLVRPIAKGRKCRLRDLRAWCRHDAKIATCARCSRSVGEPHNTRKCFDSTPVTVWDCVTDSVMGDLREPRRCGMIGEALVNHIALSDTLAEAPGDVVRVETSSDQLDPVRIFGDRWIVIFMPIRRVSSTGGKPFTKWSGK
jgi:hypothetical protein